MCLYSICGLVWEDLMHRDGLNDWGGASGSFFSHLVTCRPSPLKADSWSISPHVVFPCGTDFSQHGFALWKRAPHKASRQQVCQEKIEARYLFLTLACKWYNMTSGTFCWCKAVTKDRQLRFKGTELDLNWIRLLMGKWHNRVANPLCFSRTWGVTVLKPCQF